MSGPSGNGKPDILVRGAAYDWSKPYMFADGMRVFPDGTVTGAGVDTSAVHRKVLGMVKEYVNGYAESVKGVGLTPPSNGDCWGCLMTTKAADGKSLPPGQGDITGLDHYMSHFEEKYFVPSLYWRALQPRGAMVNPHYKPEFAWQMDSQAAKAGRVEPIKRTLRAYFKPLIPALVEHVAGRDACTCEEGGI